MKESKKYTAGEAAAIGIGVPLVFAMMYLALLPLLLLRAWVLVKLYGWFVVPTFHLQPLSVASMYGLSILYGAFTMTADFRKDDREFQWLTGFIGLVTGPLTLLLIGYLVHTFFTH